MPKSSAEKQEAWVKCSDQMPPAGADDYCFACWHPIETAPNDGTHVHLYRPKTQFVGYYGGANSGWRINAPGFPSMWPEPTHWMPLPALPVM